MLRFDEQGPSTTDIDRRISEIENRPLLPSLPRLFLIAALIVVAFGAAVIGIDVALGSAGPRLRSYVGFVALVVVVAVTEAAVLRHSDKLEKSRWRRFRGGAWLGVALAVLGLMLLSARDSASVNSLEPDAQLALLALAAAVAGTFAGCLNLWLRDGEDKKRLVEALCAPRHKPL